MEHPWRLARVVAILLAAWPVAVGILFWLWTFEHRSSAGMESSLFADNVALVLCGGPLLLFVGVARQDLRLATAGLVTFFVLTSLFGLSHGFLLWLSGPFVLAAYLVFLFSHHRKEEPVAVT